MAKKEIVKEYKPVATARMQRIAPRKVRLVLDLIRNKPVAEAINVVNNTDKKASKIVYKLINSALANAQNLNDEGKAEFNLDTLCITKAFANEGPTLKRIRPRAQGRASAINKRTSHITIELGERKEA